MARSEFKDWMSYSVIPVEIGKDNDLNRHLNTIEPDIEEIDRLIGFPVKST